MNTDLQCVRCGRAGHRSSQCKQPNPMATTGCQHLTQHKTCSRALEEGKGIVWCSPAECRGDLAKGVV